MELIRGEFHFSGIFSIVGNKNQSFRGHIQPSDGFQMKASSLFSIDLFSNATLCQASHHGRTSLWVVIGYDLAIQLVYRPNPWNLLALTRFVFRWLLVRSQQRRWRFEQDGFSLYLEYHLAATTVVVVLYQILPIDQGLGRTNDATRHCHLTESDQTFGLITRYGEIGSVLGQQFGQSNRRRGGFCCCCCC